MMDGYTPAPGDTSRSLYDAQLAREDRMAEDGARRYDQGLEDMASRGENAGTTPNRRLTRAALPEVSKALQERCEAVSEGQRNNNTLRVLKAVEALGFPSAAFIGLNVCFGFASMADVRKAANAIGRMAESELWSRQLREDDPRAFDRIFTRTKTKRRRKRLLREASEDLSWERWDIQHRIHVGEFILNGVLIASGLFRVTSDRQIVLTDDAREWVSDVEERERWMRPLYRPMVVQPQPWGPEGAGPYLSDLLNDACTLVRRNWDGETQRLIKTRMERGSMKPCLDAINAIQSTAYRINRPVMDMVLWAWELNLGGEIKKLPRSSLVEEPEVPADFEELPAEQQRQVLRTIHETRDLNRSIESNALAFQQTMQEAEDLAGFDRFWLPHNLDFRGRVYPIPHFNHQREDYVSALFEFADAKPLGPRGAFWLAVHLVGCGEFDRAHKRPLRERYNWVLDNEATILAVAEDPRENTFWMLADKPFKFLAACLEWAGYKRDGERFLSRLPIALDGSNSGLQHYSMALRAEGDAFHVNLRDVEEPQDVYQAVADVCERKAREALNQPDEMVLAKLWLDYGITRKVVKRQVMTYAYSSEKFGFKQQLVADLMKPLQDAHLQGRLPEHPFGEWSDQSDAAQWLAGVIWDAIHEVISSAAEGMQWFKSVARLLASEGRATTWTTPVGFPVMHKYEEYDVSRVRLHIFDQSIDVIDADKVDRVENEGVFRQIAVNLRTRPNGKLKKSKQKSAVAPNVIHSMDAAHLMRTVLQASSEGMSSFCMIHDSFATHAGDTERFFWLIRETLVEMYEEFDIFQHIYDTAWAQLSQGGRLDLPEPPSKGRLDTSEVLRSQYSFC